MQTTHSQLKTSPAARLRAGEDIIRTLVTADMILDRPPSEACVSAMQASGDQWTATVPMSSSTSDTPPQSTTVIHRSNHTAQLPSNSGAAAALSEQRSDVVVAGLWPVAHLIRRTRYIRISQSALGTSAKLSRARRIERIWPKSISMCAPRPSKSRLQ